MVETADGEVEFLYKGKNDDKKGSSDIGKLKDLTQGDQMTHMFAGLGKNDNAERVKLAEQAKR